MQLQVMLLIALPAQVTHHWAFGNPVVARASLGIPDTLAIFVVALVVFGPKRLPEIGKQIGKLVFEFRRASNDFKLQIEEELRVSEQQDRQKVLDMQATAAKPATPIAISAESTVSAVPEVEISADSAPETPDTFVPEPPDRRPDLGSLTSTTLSDNSLHTPEPDAVVEPPALTIQPPSTGTLVSALPPNHAAKNVMTAIPPASGAHDSEADAAEEAQAQIHSDATTAHNG